MERDYTSVPAFLSVYSCWWWHCSGS